MSIFNNFNKEYELIDPHSYDRNHQQRFTCASCQIAFISPEAQRIHHRTDWHKYNLKRKVAELPPVSAKVFLDLVHAQKTKIHDIKLDRNASFPCSLCAKTYSTKNAFLNHLHSKRHKHMLDLLGVNLLDRDVVPTNSKSQNSNNKNFRPQRLQAIDKNTTFVKSSPQPENFRAQLAKATTEEEVQGIWDAKVASAPQLKENECLFCIHKSTDFESNMSHMAKSHSFYIPDMEYLPDIKALIVYLAEKIAVYNICLYCNGRGKSFHSLEAVRKHMMDKGHTKIWYGHNDGGGDGVDVAEFYDFSSTWNDIDEESSAWEDIDDDDDACMGKMLESVNLGNVKDEASSDGSNSNQVTTAMIHVNARKLQGGSTKPHSKSQSNSYEINPELVLPSGRRAGHRSYNVYWKQSLPPRSESPNKSILQRLKQKYKLLGWNSANGSSHVIGLDKNKLIAAKKEVMARQAQARLQLGVYNDFKSRIGKIHNNQKHFRDATGLL